MLLKPVSKNDYHFLYALLQERPGHVNISHKEMPTFEQHCTFCDSNPYAAWFIITVPDRYYNNERTSVGSVYKTRAGEIGIFIKKEYQGRGYAHEAIREMCKLLPGRNLANIAPANEKSKKLFESLGFKKIQETYELTS